MQKSVDTLLVVSNDKLLQIVPDNTPLTVRENQTVLFWFNFSLAHTSILLASC
jgi:cell division GTPase FtsZ